MPAMHVSDVMRRNPVWCAPTDTLKRVGKLMAEHNCGFLPVVDGGLVVGVITDRDLGLALARIDQRASGVKARQAMTLPVISCEGSEPLATALERMREEGVRRLVVRSAQGGLEGILSLDDAAIAARAIGPEAGIPIYSDVARTLQGVCVAQTVPSKAF